MNSKRKIGLNTFCGLNYGSNLQCFATKSFVEHFGFQCDRLSIRTAKWDKMKIILNYVFILLRYPSFIKKLYNIRNCKNNLSTNTIKLMNQFVSDYLKPIRIDYKNLSSIDQYSYFITGSDQVWNVTCDVSVVHFLQFAPQKKRIALATSFGISEIPKYNQKALSKALNGFDFISVREETGVEIVKKYSKAKVCRIADPTFIYNAEEWRYFMKDVKPVQKKYILVHFLDAPNEVAVESANWLSEKFNLDVIAIGYNYDSFVAIKRFSFVDGGPWEYVSMIDNAEFVLTDSFHTSLFSINFDKRFFIFHRQYTVSKQTSRITDLLKRFDLENRLIENVNQLHAVFLENLPKKTQAILEKERETIRDYIQKSISGQIPQCFFLQGENYAG